MAWSRIAAGRLAAQRLQQPGICGFTQLVFCLLAVTACSEKSPSAPSPVSREVVLAPGQTASVTEAGITLRFDGVSGDSRCPADAICITGWRRARADRGPARSGQLAGLCAPHRRHAPRLPRGSDDRPRRAVAVPTAAHPAGDYAPPRVTLGGDITGTSRTVLVGVGPANVSGTTQPGRSHSPGTHCTRLSVPGDSPKVP